MCSTWWHASGLWAPSTEALPQWYLFIHYQHFLLCFITKPSSAQCGAFSGISFHTWSTEYDAVMLYYAILFLLIYLIIPTIQHSRTPFTNKNTQTVIPTQSLSSTEQFLVRPEGLTNKSRVFLCFCARAGLGRSVS